MPYNSKQASGSRTVGLVIVALLHIGIVYAVINGLGRKAIEIVRGPIETQIIEEKQPDKPPPPPPPPPKFDTPPPPFVPPVEVNVEVPPPPNPPIQTVTQARPAEVVPPRPAPPVAAPPAPPPARGAKIDAKSFTRPDYPSASVRLNEEGSVVIGIFCDPDGRISDAKVETTSGFDRLDDAAVREAKRGRWRCIPAEQDGKPVGSWGSFKYTFRLQDAR